MTGGRMVQAGGSIQGSFREAGRQFKQGDRAYLNKIDVKDKEVQYVLTSFDTYEESPGLRTRYVSFLIFQFPEGFLETADANAVKKIIDEVIAPEDEVKVAATKSVELGQTPEQVEAVLGRPDKIVNLGAKKVYVYKDMKIVFVDDKVSDVQ